MKGNDQKFGPDSRARSPGMGHFTNMEGTFPSKSQSYAGSERMTFSQTDFARLNMGGGMPYQSSGMTQNYYEMDYKAPSYPTTTAPQPYSIPDYSSMLMDTNQMFVPRSKYLQEELKSQSKAMQMEPTYQNMTIPQPQKYSMKPEMPK